MVQRSNTAIDEREGRQGKGRLMSPGIRTVVGSPHDATLLPRGDRHRQLIDSHKFEDIPGVIASRHHGFARRSVCRSRAFHSSGLGIEAFGAPLAFPTEPVAGNQAQR
jgi:hypothetical protein